MSQDADLSASARVVSGAAGEIADRSDRRGWPGWEPASRTKLVLLGTGTPNPDPDRAGAALAVVVDDVWYVVDSGPGMVRRIAAAARLPELEAHRGPWFSRLFISHLHSDHTVGLADAIFTPWVDGRDVPLQIYGPAGIAKVTDHLSAAYEEDVRIRCDGSQPTNREGYKVETSEIAAGVVYRDDRVRVEAFAVDHGSWKHAFGFRFETPDRVVVVSGDTRPCEAVVEAARGADILVHEVYSHARLEKRAAEWQRYHTSYHTSTLELAEIAARSRPRLLVLTHQLFWGATEQDLLAEVRASYDGPVVSGRDLDVY